MELVGLFIGFVIVTVSFLAAFWFVLWGIEICMDAIGDISERLTRLDSRLKRIEAQYDDTEITEDDE